MLRPGLRRGLLIGGGVRHRPPAASSTDGLVRRSQARQEVATWTAAADGADGGARPHRARRGDPAAHPAGDHPAVLPRLDLSRASTATSITGTRTSARTSSRARCWPRSTRPTSTSSSPRRAPRSPAPRRTTTSPSSPATATTSWSRTSTCRSRSPTTRRPTPAPRSRSCMPAPPTCASSRRWNRSSSSPRRSTASSRRATPTSAR